MTFEMLENTLSILQREIALWKTQVVAVVEPGLVLVDSLLGIETGEQSRRFFVGVAKIFAQNARGVREVNDVIAKEKIVFDNVPRSPPRNAMSLPARIGTQMSASALVRENLGST